MSVNGFPPPSIDYRHSYHIPISQPKSAYFEDKHGLTFINSLERVATFCGKALLNTTLQLNSRTHSLLTKQGSTTVFF
jgi:hypothetical protein